MFVYVCACGVCVRVYHRNAREDRVVVVDLLDNFLHKLRIVLVTGHWPLTTSHSSLVSSHWSLVPSP